MDRSRASRSTDQSFSRQAHPVRPERGLHAALGCAFFLSGAAALVYELVWFRMLGHVFGSTATAGATLLAAYLFGLGAGALLVGRLSDRLARPGLVYVLSEVGIGIYGLASHALLQRGAALYALAHDVAAGSHARLLAARFTVSFVLVAIPTILMGGTFPLMVRLLASRGGQIGRAVGRAYAINTAGAAAGAILLPLALLPRLGVLWTLVLSALLNLAAALLALLYVRGAEAPAAAATEADGRRVDLARNERARARRQADDHDRYASDPEHGSERPRLGTSPVLGTSPALDKPAALVLGGFFLSSFAALALETVWARHLGILFGARIHTFAFILFAYLVGLFLGSASYARLRARGRSPLGLLRAGLLIAAVTVGATIPVLDRALIPQVAMMIHLGVSHGAFLLSYLALTVLLILPPALGFGMVLPAVVDWIASRGARAGASVGLVYAVNTAGTTLGALGAGFLLVPGVGTQRTIEASVLMIAAALAISLLPGVPTPAGFAATDRAKADGGADGGGASAKGRGALVVHPREKDAGGRASPGRSASPGGRASPETAAFPGAWLRPALPGLFLLVLVLPRWDWALAHARYSKDPLSFVDAYIRGTLAERLSAHVFPLVDEGTEATVAVGVGKDDRRLLFVNGKPDASNLPGDMLTQRLLGCLPLMFHPDAKRAFVIGLGSGTTVGTLARSTSLEAIDVAEISPEVARAAKRWFAEVNDRCLDDPRVQIHVDDGRNDLHFRPPSSYDLIVSEPSNPWVSGVSGLFADEFFADVKTKLRPGGIFCQWFHFYSMSIDHVRLAVRTFAARFPESAVFLPRLGDPTGDMILIGSNGPLVLRHLPEDPGLPAGVRAALEEVKNAAAQPLLSGLVAGPGQASSLAGPGPIQTDDRPILELEAPADLFTVTFLGNLQTLLGANARVVLPVALPEAPSAATDALAADGFTYAGAPLRGGAGIGESRRHAIVLTKANVAEQSIARWVLVGTEIREGRRATAFDRMARVPAPFEIPEIVAALAGSAPSSEGGQTMIGGHPAVWSASESGSERTVAVGWFCDRLGRGQFVTRREPIEAAPADRASAEPRGAASAQAWRTRMVGEIVARVSCDHTGR